MDLQQAPQHVFDQPGLGAHGEPIVDDPRDGSADAVKLRKRRGNLDALEIAHQLVSFAFYGLILCALGQFGWRLFVVPQAVFSNLLLKSAIYCTEAAGAVFLVMLVLGAVGKTQSD